MASSSLAILVAIDDDDAIVRRGKQGRWCNRWVAQQRAPRTASPAVAETTSVFFGSANPSSWTAGVVGYW
jgi:hypothetical protein